MNVCAICSADGVMEALGDWYCVNHLEDGFLEVAAYLARARGWDERETSAQLNEWMDQ